MKGNLTYKDTPISACHLTIGKEKYSGVSIRTLLVSGLEGKQNTSNCWQSGDFDITNIQSKLEARLNLFRYKCLLLNTEFYVTVR